MATTIAIENTRSTAATGRPSTLSVATDGHFPWAPAEEGESHASPRQVAFALSLLDRHRGELLHDLLPKPTRGEVAELSKSRCSALIDLLKSDRGQIEEPVSRAYLQQVEADLAAKLEDFSRWRDEDGWHLDESAVSAYRRRLSAALARVRRQLGGSEGELG